MVTTSLKNAARATPITLQALDTLLSSSARLSKPVLCLMIGLLLWSMRVTSLVLIKDSTYMDVPIAVK